jgi:hypothetical protein
VRSAIFIDSERLARTPGARGQPGRAAAALHPALLEEARHTAIMALLRCPPALRSFYWCRTGVRTGGATRHDRSHHLPRSMLARPIHASAATTRRRDAADDSGHTANPDLEGMVRLNKRMSELGLCRCVRARSCLQCLCCERTPTPLAHRLICALDLGLAAVPQSSRSRRLHHCGPGHGGPRSARRPHVRLTPPYLLPPGWPC